MKKRKPIKINSQKLLLDTSVQISKFVPNPERDIRSLIPKNSYLYSSYFVLYEFKTGFIRNLIEFYYRVKLYDNPSKALAWWSNRFSKRELTNITIMQALMGKVTNSIPTNDTQRYLFLLEGIIFSLVTNFDTDLKGIVGDFGGDELIKFRINTREDYEPFVSRYNSRKSIPMDKFWHRNISALKKLVDNKDKFDKEKKLKSIYEKLVEVEKDFKNSNKYPINKSLGDVVISVDTPPNLIVTTIDRSFKQYCEILEKKYLNLLD